MTGAVRTEGGEAPTRFTPVSMPQLPDHLTQRIQSPTRTHDPQRPVEDEDSLVAKVASAAVVTTIVGSNVKSWGLDRSRLAVAGYLQKKEGTGVRFLTLAKDYLRGPTTSSVPVHGGRWGLWGSAARLSNAMGSTLALVTYVSAATNLYAGVEKEGALGLVNDWHGRTGVVQATTASVSLSFALRAGFRHRDPGQGFWQAFAGSTWLSTPRQRNIRFAAGMAVGLLLPLNVFGALDFLNGVKR